MSGLKLMQAKQKKRETDKKLRPGMQEKAPHGKIENGRVDVICPGNKRNALNRNQDQLK